jgi:hypothetical protein
MDEVFTMTFLELLSTSGTNTWVIRAGPATFDTSVFLKPAIDIVKAVSNPSL